MRLSARLVLGSVIAATACLAYACSGTETAQPQPDASDRDTGLAVEAGGDVGKPDSAPPTCGSVPATTTLLNNPPFGWTERGPCSEGCAEGSRAYEVYSKTSTPLRPQRMDECRLLSNDLGENGLYLNRWCCKPGCYAEGVGLCAAKDLPDGGDGATKPLIMKYNCPALPDGGYASPTKEDGNCVTYGAPNSSTQVYCCGDFQK